MIKDPIVFNSSKPWDDILTEWLMVSQDETLFFDHTDHGICWIGLANRGREDIWATNTTSKIFFTQLEGGVDREVFLDLLMSDYPEYFEWFLFHPELL